MPVVASIVFRAAGAAVLVATAGLLIGAFRRRRDGRRTTTPLERAQTVSIAIAATGLGLYGLLDNEVANAVWVTAVFATLGITVARWRRNEPLLPDWL